MISPNKMNENRQKNSDDSSSQQPSMHAKKGGTQRLIQPELFSDSHNNDNSDSEITPNHNTAEEQNGCKRLNDDSHNSPIDLEEAKEYKQTVMTIHQDDPRSVGQTLLEARNLLSLTIEDVANDTHIRNDYIKYIEANEFNKLPSATIYTKSYIRSLCRLYNLNPDNLINKFEETFFETRQIKASGDGKRKTSKSGENAQNDSGDERPQKRRLHLTLSWAIAILVCIIALITLIYSVTGKNSLDDSIESPGVTQKNSLITEAELDQFIIPEQLPLSELSIPENGEEAEAP